jgi:hypothetical protein
MGAASQYPDFLKLKFQYFTARMYAFLFDADSVLEIRARHFSSSRKHKISIFCHTHTISFRHHKLDQEQNLPSTLKKLFIS